jgi:hypothetical protein
MDGLIVDSITYLGFLIIYTIIRLLLKDKYDERFYRMWKYYLLQCAALFRTRQIQLWQIVFSKKGIKNGYQSIR